ncbi:MAG: ATP-binding protein [Chloroflexi bacterium]|nr:ATP-binding protein [Chloroflexota bacterium]MBU1748727.1 ATP-binding protein [Chloroflexota bacterium]
MDFKIQCDAFASGDMAPRAELAKDICAMANNGYIASYIIIGVSDDGQDFRSVSNQKLTDDNLQDFCKKAIFPPPKVKVYRKRWKRASLAHVAKEFVIIQVGPQRRQVFRLAQDFINYGEKICYRRNEVWIRRGATTDLATPEEICRIASGQPLQEDKEDEQRRLDREVFARESERERKNAIAGSAITALQEIGYSQLPRREWGELFPLYHQGVVLPVQFLWKHADTTVTLICVLSCRTGMTSKELEGLDILIDWCFAKWDLLPQSITKLTTRKVRVVRRIWLVPVLGSVPASRVAKAFPSLRRSGSALHYFRADLRDLGHSKTDKSGPVASSSELLIVDKIKSVPDFKETIAQVVSEVEREKATVIVPTKK